MKASQSKWVRIISEMVEHFFGKECEDFQIDASQASKKNTTDKGCFSVNFSTKGDLPEVIHDETVIDSPEGSTVMKAYLQDKIDPRVGGDTTPGEKHDITFVNYLDFCWNYHSDKLKDEQQIQVAIGFKLS